MAPGGGGCVGADVVGAGCCHLGGGEGSSWPTNVEPSGGLGWALLGSWAKLAIRSYGSPAAGGSGNLATKPPSLPIPAPPSPSMPVAGSLPGVDAAAA